MASARSYARSFAGGEVTPEFFARFDDVKNQTGLATCRNAIVLPHGPVTMRGGLRTVAKARNPSEASQLLAFVFANDQSFVIEMGNGYFRFHTGGETLLYGTPTAWDSVTAFTRGDVVSHSGSNYYAVADSTNQAPPDTDYWYALPSTAYEVPHPYAEADLFRVKAIQSNDVITLTHPDYPPAELRRYGNTDWRYGEIGFGATVGVPTNLRATAKRGASPGTATVQSYVVTAVRGSDESASSGA